MPNVVNLAKKSAAKFSLIVRHRDQPGVASCVFGKLADGGINAHETENIIFENGEAAIARINVDKQPPAALLESLKGCAGIMEVSVVELA